MEFKENDILVIGAAVAVGAGLGFVVSRSMYKKHYVEELERQMNEMKYYYESRLTKERKNFVDAVNEVSNRNANEAITENSAYPDKFVDYTSFSKETNVQKDYAKSEGRTMRDYIFNENEEELEEDDEEEIELIREREADQRAQKVRGPVLVSKRKLDELGEPFGNIGDLKTLVYYVGDDTLVDEDNNRVIRDPRSVIGDALTKHGFKHNDEMSIFVRDERPEVMTDYEIIKNMNSYSDFV